MKEQHVALKEGFSIDEEESDQRSADWKAAKLYNERGLIYGGKVEAFNIGGSLVRFYSLLGFLPFPELSRSYSCSEPHKPIQEIGRGLIGSFVSVKDGSVDSTMDGSFGYDIEPFPGLESRIEELLQEDGRIILLERKVMALIPRLGWMHLVVL